MQGFHIPLYLKGCAMSGLIADAKTLIDKARVETQVQIQIQCVYNNMIISLDFAQE